MGIKTFCLFPTVTGDWLGISGDDPWPVGDENAGVADLLLLSETKIVKIVEIRTNLYEFKKSSK